MIRDLSVAAASLAAAAILLLSIVPTTPQAQLARSAQVKLGAELFTQHCAVCHGADGRRGAAFQTPLWGQGAQIARFGTAQGLFEYHQLLMPFDDPSKLNDEQKWAITAFMLAGHGALAADKTLGPDSAKGVAIK